MAMLASPLDHKFSVGRTNTRKLLSRPTNTLLPSQTPSSAYRLKAITLASQRRPPPQSPQQSLFRATYSKPSTLPQRLPTKPTYPFVPLARSVHASTRPRHCSSESSIL